MIFFTPVIVKHMIKKFKIKKPRYSEQILSVKTILLSDKPNLRYQTNKNFHPDEVKAKLTDPTWKVMVDLMVKKYFDKE